LIEIATDGHHGLDYRLRPPGQADHIRNGQFSKNILKTPDDLPQIPGRPIPLISFNAEGGAMR
jgi:hypothetical protein